MRKLFLILGGLFLMVSCSTDLEKYNEKLEECFEDKQEELDTEYADMDEAIAEFEFDIAHKFFACYQPSAFYEGSIASIGYGHLEPHTDAKERLVKSEVSFLMKSNEFERALQAYEELNSFETVEPKYYFNPSYQKNSEGRYQIYYKAVYHYLEEGDKVEATKWAKRAPSDVSVDGKLLSSWDNPGLSDQYGSKPPPSQMEVLLQDIENY